MKLINKIEKKDYPKEWGWFTEEYDWDLSDKEHRRGATFYFTPVYRIDHPDHPELTGVWEGDATTWSDDWGMEDTPDTLYRLVEKEETVIKKSWVRSD